MVNSEADAVFTLYEDDNETYAYEEGEYSMIDVSWSEKDRMLSFSAPKGNAQPQLKERTFNVKVLTPKDNGVIVDEKSILYKNKKLQLQF